VTTLALTGTRLGRARMVGVVVGPVLSLGLLAAACGGGGGSEEIFSADDAMTTSTSVASTAGGTPATDAAVDEAGNNVASDALKFEQSANLGGGSVESNEPTPDVTPDEGSVVSLSTMPTEPAFWGSLGVVYTSVTGYTIDGHGVAEIEFEAQNAIDQPRQFPIEVMNLSYGNGVV
jgi:hypothetical protein